MAKKATEANAGAATAPAPERKSLAKRFSPEQIAEMRKLRNTRGDDGKILWSHAKLAEKFDTNAGTVSMIVRNRTYKDPDYVPQVDRV